MKKERKPLTTREKVLIGVGVVGACVAGYLGYKYVKDLKIIKDQKNTIDDLILIKELMSRDAEAETAKKIALEAMNAANNQEVINDITKDALEETMEELQKTKDDLSFMKFLIVEGNIVPHALQNGKNKLERVKNKMARLEQHIATYGAQKESISEMDILKNDESFLINCLEKAGMIQEMVDNDSLDYAKITHTIMRR